MCGPECLLWLDLGGMAQGYSLATHKPMHSDGRQHRPITSKAQREELGDLFPRTA